MPWLDIIASFLSGLDTFASTMWNNEANSRNVDKTNEANLEQTRIANEANLQAVAQTNSSNVQQSELAYQRSLPQAQVANLMRAGMSKTAALNALSGGGSYTAPTLSTAQIQPGHLESKHFDFSNLASAFSRLGNIPSNVNQQRLVDEQIKSLQQEQLIREQNQRIAIEKHNAEMDELKYSKWERDKINDFVSLVEQTAGEKNIPISSLENYDDLLDKLDLRGNPLFKELPASGRQRAFEYVKQNADARRIEEIHQSNLRKSEDEHKQAEQGLKLAQLHEKQLLRQIHDYDSEKSAREREYKARELAATLKYMTHEAGIADERSRQSLIYFRDHYDELVKDPTAEAWNNVTSGFDSFWNGLFKIIPLNALSKTLLGDLIKIGF